MQAHTLPRRILLHVSEVIPISFSEYSFILILSVSVFVSISLDKCYPCYHSLCLVLCLHLCLRLAGQVLSLLSKKCLPSAAVPSLLGGMMQCNNPYTPEPGGYLTSMSIHYLLYKIKLREPSSIRSSARIRYMVGDPIKPGTWSACTAQGVAEYP